MQVHDLIVHSRHPSSMVLTVLEKRHHADGLVDVGVAVLTEDSSNSTNIPRYRLDGSRCHLQLRNSDHRRLAARLSTDGDRSGSEHPLPPDTVGWLSDWCEEDDILHVRPSGDLVRRLMSDGRCCNVQCRRGFLQHDRVAAASYFGRRYLEQMNRSLCRHCMGDALHAFDEQFLTVSH